MIEGKTCDFFSASVQLAGDEHNDDDLIDGGCEKASSALRVSLISLLECGRSPKNQMQKYSYGGGRGRVFEWIDFNKARLRNQRK